MAARKKVPRTRNDGTFTEAQFRGWVRSNLRKMSQRWKPIYAKINEGSRPVTEEDTAKWGKRIRKVYHCESCGQWFPRKYITADHIIPCGSLKDIEKDAGPFILRLLCEREGIQRLCTECHNFKTSKEKQDGRA